MVSGGCMEGWMNNFKDRLIAGLVMDGWMDGWIDRWVYDWRHGWIVHLWIKRQRRCWVDRRINAGLFGVWLVEE